MEHKNKNLIFPLALYFLSLIFLFFPFQSFAQSTGTLLGGAACGPGIAQTCQAGLTCIGSTCQVGCTLDADCGNASQYCDVTTIGPNYGFCRAKITPGQTGGITGTPTPGTCPTGLTQQNGLCLPTNNPFSTGIAGDKSLTSLILDVIQLLLTFSGLIAVIVLIVGGFWYITSAGNEEQAEKGKKALINAIIGLVVVILAYAIVSIISGTLTTTNLLAH